MRSLLLYKGARNITSGEELAKFLRKQPKQNIVKALSVVALPVFDGTLIVNDPRSLYQSGKFDPIPIIIGFTANEGESFISIQDPSAMSLSEARNCVKSYVFQRYTSLMLTLLVL